MIFVTIGTQEPFDRLIKIVDSTFDGIDEEVIAQVSNSTYKSRNLKCIDFMDPIAFDEAFNNARLVISHAGMGTIITAMQKNKPLLIFPRIAALGEHRNEHQMATAKQMKLMKYIYVAFDEEELKRLIRKLINEETIRPLHQLSGVASSTLLEAIRNDIQSGQ